MDPMLIKLLSGWVWF